MNLPAIQDIGAHAFFLDFDGTLVEIAPRPELVVLRVETREALQRLHAASGGAVAIVTGRALATIDEIAAPLVLPAAGLHGLERRGADGEVHRATGDVDLSAVLGTRLADVIRDNPGVHLEAKGPAAATLHYRAAPEAEAACRAAMHDATGDLAGIHLLDGKMVIEARLDASDKGRAIRVFMAEAPFAGRTPVMAGDDVTDEDAFAVINELGGISIKVGEGDTIAQYRAQDTAAFLAWLAALPART